MVVWNNKMSCINWNSGRVKLVGCCSRLCVPSSRCQQQEVAAGPSPEMWPCRRVTIGHAQTLSSVKMEEQDQKVRLTLRQAPLGTGLNTAELAANYTYFLFHMYWIPCEMLWRPCAVHTLSRGAQLGALPIPGTAACSCCLSSTQAMLRRSPQTAAFS